MIASDADRLRWYGSAERVAAADAYIQALADAAPPLTPGQKARLRVLLARPTTTQPAAPPTNVEPAAAA